MSLIIILISKDQYMYFWSTVSTKFCHHDDILLVNIWTSLLVSSQFNLWKVLFENNVSENPNPGQKFPNQVKALSWVMAWFLISIFQLQQDNQLFMKVTCEIGFSYSVDDMKQTLMTGQREVFLPSTEGQYKHIPWCAFSHLQLLIGFKGDIPFHKMLTCWRSILFPRFISLHFNNIT